MDEHANWFKDFRNGELYKKFQTNPIAYFCAEYAVSPNLPIYAGGLGVLAADFLREAEDQNIPVVAVGLYYNDGYETLHKVNEHGYIEGPHVHAPPINYGLVPALDEKQNPIIIEVPIQDIKVKVRAWIWHMGKVPVYLLDTDVEGNSEWDKKITDHLYVIDRETRLKQEIVLGIGGVRLLEKLGIEPSIYHMNEGHSALLALELASKEMKAKSISFEDARESAKRKIVFTNHTLVVSGNEIFNNELISLVFSKYASELGIPIDKIIDAGRVPDSNSFSLTLLSLRSAGKVNGVSNIHAKKAKEVWPEHEMVPITNGIHLDSWNSIYDNNSVWDSHQENKRLLLQKIKMLTNISWGQDTLLLGWARRLVNYKRPKALFEDIGRIRNILQNEQKSVRIVVSGTLHPSDVDAQKTFDEFRNIFESELKGLAVFLPGYDLILSKLMTSGCDVWLNTPIVGFEACGTSGMKAALNGVLPLSTRDGWMDEVDFFGIGWPLEDDKINQSLLETIEQKIIPFYYEKDAEKVPLEWIKNMRNARDLIKNRFSATRMLRDYIEKLYSPLLT